MIKTSVRMTSPNWLGSLAARRASADRRLRVDSHGLAGRAPTPDTRPDRLDPNWKDGYLTHPFTLDLYFE